MSEPTQIELLKLEIQNGDYKAAAEATALFIKIDRNAALDYFISELTSKDPVIRGRVALGLYDLEDNKAVKPLLKAINKPENFNSNGTLAFALSALDCTTLLKEIFDLLFYGNAEVRMSAALILDEQIFEFSKADLLSIKAKWDSIKKNPQDCPYFEKYKEQIQDFVDSFLCYLK